MVIPVQEQHPREQGLKHMAEEYGIIKREGSRATSTRTRIETGPRERVCDHLLQVQEQHPREQGLKLDLPDHGVGLELVFKSNIHENKD